MYSFLLNCPEQKNNIRYSNLRYQMLSERGFIAQEPHPTIRNFEHIITREDYIKPDFLNDEITQTTIQFILNKICDEQYRVDDIGNLYNFFNEKWQITQKLIFGYNDQDITKESEGNFSIQAEADQEAEQEMENVPLVMEKTEIDKIETKKFNEYCHDIKENNKNCIFCRDDFQDNDNVRRLKCSHIFHNECIDSWLSDHSYKCPCCRVEAGNHVPKIN
jgi:hypothetical protein